MRTMSCMIFLLCRLFVVRKLRMSFELLNTPSSLPQFDASNSQVNNLIISLVR
jgi:hypothetical protein